MDRLKFYQFSFIPTRKWRSPTTKEDIKKGVLRPVHPYPNNVSSQTSSDDKKHYCAPFFFDGKVHEAKRMIKKIVNNMQNDPSLTEAYTLKYEHLVYLHFEITNSKREMFPQPTPDAIADEKWIPNSDRSECMGDCGTKFGMMGKRHHCRRCGDIFCSNCSNQKIDLKFPDGVKLARICNQCLEDIQEAKEAHTSTTNKHEEFQKTCKVTHEKMVSGKINEKEYYQILTVAINNLRKDQPSSVSCYLSYLLHFKLINESYYEEQCAIQNGSSKGALSATLSETAITTTTMKNESAPTEEKNAQSSTDVRMTGYLEWNGGRSSSEFIGRRYWILKEKKLTYFENSSQDTYKGQVDLDNTYFQIETSDMQNQFVINTEERSYYFQAETKTESDKWIQVLKPLQEGVSMNGYLEKQGQRRQKWKRRWFILEGNEMLYYTDSDLVRFKSRINICNARIHEEQSKNKNEFQIECIDKTYYLRASNRDEKLQWLRALRAAAKLPESEVSKAVDDLEFLFDSKKKRIDFASGAQIGYCDKCCNRYRIEYIRQSFQKMSGVSAPTD